jgi:hypothetical protein
MCQRLHRNSNLYTLCDATVLNYVMKGHDYLMEINEALLSAERSALNH